MKTFYSAMPLAHNVMNSIAVFSHAVVIADNLLSNCVKRIDVVFTF